MAGAASGAATGAVVDAAPLACRHEPNLLVEAASDDVFDGGRRVLVAAVRHDQDGAAVG